MKPTKDYGNESITALKGADRVRKRPSVIFGSDGLDGCQHIKKRRWISPCVAFLSLAFSTLPYLNGIGLLPSLVFRRVC